jgi:hypothetical protein
MKIRLFQGLSSIFDFPSQIKRGIVADMVVIPFPL